MVGLPMGQRAISRQYLENYQLGRLQRKNMITITEQAVAKIKDIIAEENNPALKLRVFVQGGGCSGMQYGFTLDEEQAEDDWDLDINGVRILVDSMSGGYLQGAEVDYREDQYGSSFSIKNPQAVTTCGCGSSFSPE
jgi:iron-sulfur cluster insertion protein